MLHEYPLGVVVSFGEYFFDFHIHLLGSALAAITLKSAVGTGKEEAILAMSTMSQADALAHSEDANHLTRNCGGVLQIVLGPGCHFAKYDLLSRAATQHAANAVQEL